MTFLEYVFARLVGRPDSGGSCYRCPHCEHRKPSITINPPLAGRATKWRCHRCGVFGDEFDVLKTWFGVRDYGVRLAQVAALRAEYEAQSPSGIHAQPDPAQTTDPRTRPTDAVPRADDALILPRGVGSTGHTGRVDETWEALTDEAREQLLGLYATAFDRDVSLDALAAYGQTLANFQWLSDQEHLRWCDDPECDARVCRAARGLPPLTPEEVQAGTERIREERRRWVEEWPERMARARAALRIPGRNGRADRAE